MKLKRKYLSPSRALVLACSAVVLTGASSSQCGNLSIVVEGSGTVFADHLGQSCTSACSFTVEEGMQLTLSTEADDGYFFLGWTGACSGVNPVCTFEASTTNEVNAHFEAAVSLPDLDVYQEDLEFVSRFPREPLGEHHAAVRDLCAQRFAELGYEVEQQTYGDEDDGGVNVIGTRLGSAYPERKVVVAAHYDSVPGCNGADDNGSGVAGLFQVASLLANEEHDYTVVVACLTKRRLGCRALEPSPNAPGRMATTSSWRMCSR